MKLRSISRVSIFALIALLISVSAAHAQRVRATFAAEVRPFDFSDKFYQNNGVWPERLLDRRNGVDGRSVFGYINDDDRRGVRIIETRAAYSTEGAPVFWNHYADVPADAIMADAAGDHAAMLGELYPIYVFPSAATRSRERQAPLIRTDADYFEKNPLGIGAIIVVDYTDKITTREGQAALRVLGERNGYSLDDTPIIRTAKEIATLARYGYVRLRRSGGDDFAAFKIAKILDKLESGAIAPDAYIVYVTKPDGDPLDAERHIVTRFECFKIRGAECL